MTRDGTAPAWLDRTDYTFASHWAALREGRLHYVDQGEGPLVVFSHGTPTWSYEFRHIIRVVSHHFRCIAPDHLGFGLSDRPAAASYAPEAHAERFRDRRVDRVADVEGAPVGHRPRV